MLMLIVSILILIFVNEKSHFKMAFEMARFNNHYRKHFYFSYRSCILLFVISIMNARRSESPSRYHTLITSVMN